MFLIQHTKYPQRVFVAYAHLYYRLFEQNCRMKKSKYNKTRLIAGFVVRDRTNEPSKLAAGAADPVIEHMSKAQLEKAIATTKKTHARGV